MRVSHLSFSSAGGAGRVAQELSRLQTQLGIESKLVTRSAASLAQAPFQHPIVTGLAAFDAVISNHAKPTLFTHFRDFAYTKSVKSLANTDILHLHWTPGLINSNNLVTLGKLNPGLRVVWTLHDMFAFTGGCHHSFECSGYEKDCGNCPQVRTSFKQRPSIALGTKVRNLAEIREITFVSPSRWIAQKAMSSILLRGSKVSVIPNPINLNFTAVPLNQSEAREVNGYRSDSIIAILIAEDLADPNKSIQEFVNLVEKTTTISQIVIEVVLIGRNADKIRSSSAVIHRVGSLTPVQLSKLLPVADFLAVPSKVENAPSIVLEAASVGVPSLVNSENEGAVELAIGKQLGATFDPNSVTFDSVSDLVRLRRSPRVDFRKIALEYASGDVSARSYMNLYEQVLKT
jgi:glycosyltransferase involved in cell wall biosynthesis